MNSEQKYKQALERAKDMLAYKEVHQEDMEYLFPELKESWDEKIRNRLIAMCHHYIECYSLDPYNVDDYKEALAWLDKQGEQKQTWKPSAAQLIVIKSLIEDKNTSKVNKVILRGMFDEFKQNFMLC